MKSGLVASGLRRRFEVLIVTALLALTALAAPAVASAQQVQVSGSLTVNGVANAGTAVAVFSAQPANGALYGSSASFPASLQSVTITARGLGGTPTSTTFTGSDLTGLILEVGPAGVVTDFNFFSTAANADGYTILGRNRLTGFISKGGNNTTYNVIAPTFGPVAAASVPTLGEWGLLGLSVSIGLTGLALVGRSRRRSHRYASS